MLSGNNRTINILLARQVKMHGLSVSKTYRDIKRPSNKIVNVPNHIKLSS